jgi:hypothetical protein
MKTIINSNGLKLTAEEYNLGAKMLASICVIIKFIKTTKYIFYCIAYEPN